MKFLAALLILLHSQNALSQVEETLNFQEVVKVLEAEQPKTVAQALLALKTKHPSYFENYALVSRSMSIQGSTSQNPRVVLFDQGAKLVMSFNGQVGERGYDRLEVMSFDDLAKAYDFREIKFFGDSNSEGTFEISESGGINGRCLHCHGDTALPIWDSYPFWPDYYGAFAHSYRGANLKQIQVNESTRYQEFLASAKTHARYQFLDPKTLSTITDMNTRIGEAFAERVRDVADRELSLASELKKIIADVFLKFMPSDFVRMSKSGVALPLNPFSADELSELTKLSEYQNTKIVRYARNYELDKGVLLDQLLELKQVPISEIAEATGVALDNKLELWTYSQIQPVDLILVPRLRAELGEQVLYFNMWSLVPGRRFIDFAGPENQHFESGIENAIGSLLE